MLRHKDLLEEGVMEPLMNAQGALIERSQAGNVNT